MKKVATTPIKITGQGTYDNGQYPVSYDKTEHYEVTLSFFYGRTYVNYSLVLNSHVKRGSTQCPIERVSNKEVLIAANSLLDN